MNTNKTDFTDPTVIGRMANELFKSASELNQMPFDSGAVDPSQIELPTNFSSQNLENTAKALASNPNLSTLSAPVSSNVAPTEEQLRALPAALASTSVPNEISQTSEEGLSAIPDSRVGSDLSASFSFLEEARSLSKSFAKNLQVPVDDQALDPTNFSAVNEMASIKTSDSLFDLAAPQIPGTVANAPNFLAPHSFNRLEDVRQLLPIETMPVLEPFQLSSASALSNPKVSTEPFDLQAIRRDFPILQERVNGRPLVWLDNAATTHKPQAVIDRLSYFYAHENSNIHRAAHELAARATDAYESARESVRRFLNAGDAQEIIFVRGATEGINLVAQSWGRQNIRKDDEIVITWLEHHANIVPWQMLCVEKGAKLKVAPVDNQGQIILEEYEKILGPKTKLVALTQVSNALGTLTPVQEMVALAHRHGAKVLVDGAQAVSHLQVDVQTYDCDFYVFSGHKVFAPTGIGVVYGKSALLNSMQPWQGGGNMIADVTFEKTLYQTAPFRFEAGTGNIADAVGLGAAIDYLNRIGMHNITRHEHELLKYATEALRQIPGLHLVGTAAEKAGVLSFVLDGFKTEEMSGLLNREGIAVRSGHHCAQPILRRFGLESSVRASLALYNTCEEIDALITAIWNLRSGRLPGPK